MVEGAATLQAGGEEHELRPGTFARVGPGEKRKLVTGAEGARVIALGGTPGKAYEVSALHRAAGGRPPADRLDLGIAEPRRARDGREQGHRPRDGGVACRARARASRSRSRSAERIEQAAAELARRDRRRGARLRGRHGRTSRRCRRWSQSVREALGPVEILVINTGGPPLGDPLSFGREQWESAYRSLVLAPMALIEAVVPDMRARGLGPHRERHLDRDQGADPGPDALQQPPAGGGRARSRRCRGSSGGTASC